MRIRYFALLGCLLVLCFFSPFLKEPKLVSSIVSMDTAYLTVLADEREVRDEEKFREKIYKMCLEDDFGEIKLWTEKRTSAKISYFRLCDGKRS